MNKEDSPERVEKTEDEIDEIIASVHGTNLSDSTKTFLIKCIKTACWLPHILQKKNITLMRLKKIIFGKGYGRKKPKKKNHGDDGSNSSGGTSMKNGARLRGIV